MVDTRQHTMLEVHKQVEELRLLQAKQVEETEALRSSIDGRFSTMEAMMGKIYAQLTQKQPEQPPESSSPPETDLKSPSKTKPPDPPDLCPNLGSYDAAFPNEEKTPRSAIRSIGAEYGLTTNTFQDEEPSLEKGERLVPQIEVSPYAPKLTGIITHHIAHQLFDKMCIRVQKKTSNEAVTFLGENKKMFGLAVQTNHVWKPGGVLTECDHCDWLEKCYRLDGVMRVNAKFKSVCSEVQTMSKAMLETICVEFMGCKGRCKKLLDAGQKTQPRLIYDEEKHRLKKIKCKMRMRKYEKLHRASKYVMCELNIFNKICRLRKVGRCVAHETNQIAFYVWHRWKNKDEIGQTVSALLLMDLVSSQSSKRYGLLTWYSWTPEVTSNCYNRHRGVYSSSPQWLVQNRKVPHKLSPRFYGPFRVIDRIGTVAYKLELPPEAAIHNVFHVSQLKLCPNPSTVAPLLPQYMLEVGTGKEPESILEKKMIKRQNKAVTKVLVQWKGEPPDKATWEFYQDFIAKYPAFHP